MNKAMTLALVAAVALVAMNGCGSGEPAPGTNSVKSSESSILTSLAQPEDNGSAVSNDERIYKMELSDDTIRSKDMILQVVNAETGEWKEVDISPSDVRQIISLFEALDLETIRKDEFFELAPEHNDLIIQFGDARFILYQEPLENMGDFDGRYYVACYRADRETPRGYLTDVNPVASIQHLLDFEHTVG